MKKILIIYNVIFLFAGNILLSNIHHLHHHHHNHAYDYEVSECQECIIIKHNHNFVQEFHQIKDLNNNTYLFVDEYYSIVEFDFEQSYLSRAPPIS